MKFRNCFLIYIILLTLITSCNNNKDSEVNDENISNLSKKESDKAKLDSIEAEEIRKAKFQKFMDSLESHKDDIRTLPVSKYKSFADIFSTRVTEGSNVEELLRVQGRPTLILPEDDKITYFYGNSEIVFESGFIVKINDIDNVIKYAGRWDQLVISSDPIEKRFGNFVTDRRLKAAK
jgi:hypothetical protein